MAKSGLAMLMLCSAMAAQAQTDIVAPIALPATEVTATRFMANWEPPMTGMVDAYALDVATDEQFSAFVSGYEDLDVGDVTSYPVTGLIPRTICHYRVRARNNGGASENSASISVSLAKADQTIDFALIGDQWTTATVELSATASSGLPVSFAVVDGPAVLVGSTLTFAGTGGVSIVASQAGNDEWSAAPEVTRTFAVSFQGPGVEISAESVNVREAGEGRFYIRLNRAPQGTVAVGVGRGEGDAGLTVKGKSSFSFTPSNWNTWQMGTLAAAADGNSDGESATFRISLAGAADAFVVATALDDDIGENWALASAGSLIAGTQATKPEWLIDGVHMASANYGYMVWTNLAAPGTMTLDLQVATVVSRIRLLNWDWGYRTHQYRIESSADGATWSSLVDASKGEHRGWEDWAVGGVSARYLRFTGLSNSANRYVSIAEWEVYGERDLSQMPQVEVSRTNVNVREAGEGRFYVRLDREPEANVSVGVGRVAGDEGLTVKGGAALTFTPANWSAWQMVTLAAPEDDNEVGETATFLISATGSADRFVEATSLDDDIGTNLALASEGAFIVGSGLTSTLPARLIDGVHTSSASYGYTVWTNNPPGSMTLDLTAPASVLRIRLLNWDWGYRTHRYRIESSADGAEWSVLVDADADEQRGWDDWEVNGQSIRYLRLTGLSNSANSSFCVAEWEVITARILPKADQTIDFPGVSKTIKVDSIELSATASSGLPVSFAVVSGPGSLDETGVRLVFASTGMVNVVASQAGNDQWNPAPEVVRTFTRGGGGGEMVASLWKTIPPPEEAYEGLFGCSVAADGEYLAVGAPYAAGYTGYVYLYGQHVGGTDEWGRIVLLLALDGAPGQCFGGAVALNGSVLVAGAPGGEAAYVFERDGEGVWSQTAKLIASDGAAEDYFGWQVAVAGDVIVVGASADDDAGDSSGSAYVFERNGQGEWHQVAKLTAADAEFGDCFGGGGVSIDGNLILIGAPGSTQGEYQMVSGPGAAYIFARNDQGVWGQVAKFETEVWSYGFGTGVALKDKTAFVHHNVYGSQDIVHIYDFDTSSGTWTQVKELYSQVSYQSYGQWISAYGDTLALSADDMIYLYGRNKGGENAWGELGTVQLNYDGPLAMASEELVIAGGLYQQSKGAFLVKLDADGTVIREMKGIGSNGVVFASGEAPSLEYGTDYGTLVYGATQMWMWRNFAITNAGNVPLVITDFRAYGPFWSDNAYQHVVGMLPPGGVSSFRVQYSPVTVIWSASGRTTNIIYGESLGSVELIGGTGSGETNYFTINLVGRVQQMTPTVEVWAAASDLVDGQTLSESVLTGGSASVGGAFAWLDAAMQPAVGDSLVPVKFVPELGSYHAVTGMIPVRVKCRISGRVVRADDGQGVAWARLAFGGGEEVSTAEDGSYSYSVPAGWSGTAIAQYVCVDVEPPARVYTNVQASATNENYCVANMSLPGSFSLVSPATDARVLDQTVLRWEAASCATEYEVFLGTGEVPEWVATVQTNELEQAIATNGVYQWYVVAKNGAGSVRSPTTGAWSFQGFHTIVLPGDVMVDESDLTYDNSMILKDGGQLILNGTHRFQRLTLTNGAVLTHSPATSVQETRMELLVSEVLAVSSDSSIDVSGRGYGAGRTAGNRTVGASTGYAGGSFGGKGAGGTANAGYGEYRDPDMAGSGGGNAWAGCGGGLARIQAGTLALDGVIRADGGRGSDGWSAGGGSGGGIRVRADLLGGQGQISARGGDGNGDGNGGGGGRIALYYAELNGFDLTNRVNASGGRMGNAWSGAGNGSAGTVYVRRADEAGQLRVDNRDIASSAGTSLWAESETNGFENVSIRGTNLVVEFPSGTVSAASLWIGGGAVVTHAACTTNREYQLNMVVRDALTVATNSKIDVSGRGYLAGRTLSNTTHGASSGFAGGSYGGLGGGGTANSAYGNYQDPHELGSGGGNGWSGSGGGLVRIHAGTLNVDGAILANGGRGQSGWSHGGGSGGGVFLCASNLSIQGSIQANGCNGNGDGSGGGGGRVAIYYETLSSPNVEARASVTGGGGVQAGQAGSLFITNGSPRLSVLTATPSGQLPGPVSRLSLEFNAPLQEETFSIEDVDLRDPDHQSVSLSAVRRATATEYGVELSSALTREGTYALTLGTNFMSRWNAHLTVAHVSEFTLDNTPPSMPVVTNYAQPPLTNHVRFTSGTLGGGREAGSSVWIGDAPVAALGTGAWSAGITLTQGLNKVWIHGRDAAGNRSATNEYWFFADTVAPAVSAVVPANNAVTNNASLALRMTYVEAGSGLHAARSSWTVKKTGITVPGSWETTTNMVVFTPGGALMDGVYSVAATLVDSAGNTGTYASVFTVDTVPPAVPTVSPVSSPTAISVQTIAGYRDAGSLVQVYRENVLATTLAAGGNSWSHAATLTNGANAFGFSAVDAAGNASSQTNVMILHDNAAPGPVVVTGQVQGVGTTLTLGWEGYDEVTNGADIASYTIYQHDSPFSQTAQATAIGTNAAGQKRWVVAGLTRGEVKHYAVVARDGTGLANTNVVSAGFAPVDVVAPPSPTGMVFACGATNIQLGWSAASDPDGDLIGYRLYPTNSSAGVWMDVTNRNYLQTGLLPAMPYAFRVTSVDASGNESAGLTGTGYTMLPNPSDLRITPYDGYVEMSWLGVEPSAYVSHYAIYVMTSNYASVSGLTPRLTVTGTNAALAGLANGVTHHIAVTAVNKSGGERQDVVPESAVTVADQIGPVLSNLRWNGAAMGAPVTWPGTISVAGRDPSGMSRVEFWVNGERLGNEVNSTTNYSAFWDVSRTTNDGPQSLLIQGYDTRGNQSTWSTNVDVTLAPPFAPTIASPLGTTVVNRLTQSVTGTGAVYATHARYFVNGSCVLTNPVAAGGNFSGEVSLSAGTNVIQVAAVNRAGVGAPSKSVVVVVDQSLPSAPQALTATAQAEGLIRLSWTDPAGTTVKGYYVYRSTAPIAQASQATRLNATPLASKTFSDLPTMDGTFYYRVSAVNSADTEGALSLESSATSDRIPPRVVSVEYETTGVANLAEKRFGRGVVTVNVTVSEPMQSGTFFSLNPVGGTPISVALTAISETRYRGSFTVSAGTPCGVAYATFSGRDRMGNRGTEIEQGGTLILDVCGPEVADLAVTPGDPIWNSASNPTSVTVVASFDSDDVPVTPPTVRWSLSKTRTNETAVSLSPLTTRSWAGTFALPAGAGQPAESVCFSYEGLDSFGNTGRVIRTATRFQVYQGGLPPYAAPLNLAGRACPEGVVALTWDGVEGATDYAVHRGASSNETAYIGRSMGLTRFEDNGGNATNWYAVASVRTANGQSSTGALSGAIRVVSDAQPPEAPTNLALSLQGAGMLLSWQGPSGDAVRYEIYRHGQPFTAVEMLQPRATNIPAGLWMDPSAVAGPTYYGVVAVDGVGNRSGPSACAYTNLALLPVNSFSVIREQSGAPRLSWTHGNVGGIDGFTVYSGNSGAEQLLKRGLLPNATSYVDTAYARGSRWYSIAATDWQAGQELESVRRGILLPDVTVSLPTNSLIKRGVMNRLTFSLTNTGEHAVSAARLFVLLQGHDHVSDPFDLAPGGSANIPVVLGGYTNLPPVAPLTLRVEMAPHVGETIRLTSADQVRVGSGMLVSEVLNDELVRGVPGNVRFAVQNTSDEEVQVILATSSGQVASPDVRIKLLNADGMVFGSISPKQAIGDMVETLSSGTTVARIPPGARFTSADLSLVVPTNAPSQLQLRLEVDRVHYQLGEETHVEISGMQSTRSVELSDTRYTAAVTNVYPASSLGGTNILLQGWAVNRASGLPEKNVAVNVVIAVDGFERTATVYSDSNGQWRYVFVPLANENGVYAAWAVHPSVVAKPQQAEFVITRVGIWPSPANVSIPRNYVQTIPARITAGRGMTLTNLSLSCEAADQPDGAMPAGVAVGLPQPMERVAGGQTATLPFTIRADESAPASCQIWVRVNGTGAPEGGWGVIPVNLTVLAATPALNWTPNYVLTGMAISNVVMETVTLQNSGYSAIEGMALSLIKPDGQPAPGWVRLTTPAQVGTLGVGESKSVSLQFAPTSSVSEVRHEFWLRVTASNHPPWDIHVFAGVDGSGQGGTLIKVSDIYTGTLDGQGQVVQGLAGAKITLQKESGSLVITNQVTDALGEAFFERLPEGAYMVKVSASRHDTFTERIWVRAGVTTTKEVFLPYNLVTVEWRVTPITIEDRYEVTLTTTFVTDVPAAVVVIEPASISLPESMQPGDVMKGELKITNHGLVRADEVSFEVPDGGDSFRYELLCDVPPSINAKQVVRIPYRIVKLGQTDDGNASGGGLTCTKTQCGRLPYKTICPNGHVIYHAASQCVIDYIACTASAMGSIGGLSGGFGAGGGGGSGISGGPGTSLPQTTTACGANNPGGSPPSGGCNTEACGTSPGDPCDPKLPAKSVVSVSRGDYEDEVTDIRVKVAGGSVGVERIYDNATWTFGDLEPASGFYVSIPATNRSLQVEEEAYCYVILNGRDYEGSVQMTGSDFTFMQGVLHANNGDRLERRGMYWELFAKKRWSRHGEDGRLLEYGDVDGPKVRLMYGEDAHVVGIQDHYTNQVLWVDYTMVNGTNRVAQVRDERDRTVSYAYDAAGNLTNVTDVAGNPTRYAYDEKNRLISKELPGQPRVEIEYHDAGTVKRVGDTHYQHQYDSSRGEYYVSVLHPDGRLEEIWYNATGWVVKRTVNGVLVADPEESDNSGGTESEWPKVTQADGTIRTEYENGLFDLQEYNGPKNQLSRVTDTAGQVTEYVYDSASRLIRMVRDAGGASERTTIYDRDDLGQLTNLSLRLPDQSLAQQGRWTYDRMGNIESYQDGAGDRMTATYDNLGNVLTICDPEGRVWNYAYDLQGRLTSATDPMGNVHSNRYDAAGRTVWQRDQAGYEYWWNYSDNGLLTSSSNNFGETTQWDYDVSGRVTRFVDADGQETHIAYDSGGEVVDADVTRDALGRITRMKTAGDVVVHMTYDLLGRLKGLNTTNISETYEYAPGGQLSRLVQSDGSTTRTNLWEYDALGNLNRMEDGEGHSTRWNLDAQGRLATRIGALGDTNRFEYGWFDETKQMADENGRVTRFETEWSNRLTRTRYPDGTESSVSVDWRGQPVQEMDSTGRINRRQYDGRGRLATNSWYSSSEAVSPDQEAWFSYDGLGRMTAYGDEYSQGTILYGSNQRTVRMEVNFGAFSKSFEYEYDHKGRKVSFLGPDGVRQRYGYDSNNRLSSLALEGTGGIQLNYSVSSQAESACEMIYPGGMRQMGTWVADGWRQGLAALVLGASQETFSDAIPSLTQKRVVDSAGQVLVDIQYHRNRVDNLASQVSGAATIDYQYDPGRRLIGVSGSQIPPETYSYDLAGNRDAQAAAPWTYDSMNRLTSWTQGSYAYDSAGRATQRVVNGIAQLFEYDARGCLVRVRDPHGNVTAEYRYDAFGRRLCKQVGDATTWYLYSEVGLIGEYDEAGNPIREYGYKPDSMWMMEPLYLKQSNEYFYYVNDHLGSPEFLMAGNGTVAWSASRSAYGITTIAPASTLNSPLRLSGQYFDEETGLHYNSARYYDPNIGRYIQPDPSGYQDGMNLYQYVANNPVNNVDPYGLALYAVGGTLELEKEKANTRSMYEASDEYPKHYYDHVGRVKRGPLKGMPFLGMMDGRDTLSLARRVKGDVCADYCAQADKCGTNAPPMPVYMLGWSRGAIVTIRVAKLLQQEGCPCAAGVQKPVGVRWLGLFDACNMTLDASSAAEIPNNVELVSHAVKTKPQLFDTIAVVLPILPTEQIKVQPGGSTWATVQPFDRYDGKQSSHGDIGANSENNGAYAWMVNEAENAGMKFLEKH